MVEKGLPLKQGYLEPTKIKARNSIVRLLARRHGNLWIVRIDEYEQGNSLDSSYWPNGTDEER